MPALPFLILAHESEAFCLSHRTVGAPAGCWQKLRFSFAFSCLVSSVLSSLSFFLSPQDCLPLGKEDQVAVTVFGYPSFSLLSPGYMPFPFLAFNITDPYCMPGLQGDPTEDKTWFLPSRSLHMENSGTDRISWHTGVKQARQ